MRIGDKVIITKGAYKNAIGYIIAIWGSQVTVEPDENADPRVFDKSEIRIINPEDD
jgi:hypothetical protein